MVYVGRFVLAGVTSEGSLAVAEGITGRSPPSKLRVLRREPYRPEMALRDDAEGWYVHPVGEPTQEQMSRPGVFFYPAVATSLWKPYEEDEPDMPIAAAANGDHILALPLKDFWEHKAGIGPASSSDEYLDRHIFEDDSLKTPRIAIVAGHMDDAGCSKCEVIAAAAILAERHRSFTEATLQKGGFMMLTTYAGDPSGPSNPELGQVNYPKLQAVTADGLAEELFDRMDTDLRVAVGTAMWDRTTHVWEFAVRNLHDNK